MAVHVLENLSALHEGYCRSFTVSRHKLLLIQVDGDIYLIEDRCPHMDAPLRDGVISSDKAIRCRAHGIEFCLKTGRAKGPLANTLDNLKTYPVIYEGTKVAVDEAVLR